MTAPLLALVVESATDTAAVALADDAGLLGSVVVARGRRHTETMAPAVETLCRRVGVALGDVTLLGVDIGPGLFTGLRVGVGTVQALAFALELPVVTATSLEILAAAAFDAGAAAGRLVVAVVDARRGEVFSNRFTAPAGPDGTGPDGTGPDGAGPVAAGTDRLWAPEALVADLAALDQPVLVVGDGARRYLPLLAAVPAVQVAGPSLAAPPVAALAALTTARRRAGPGAGGGGPADGAAVLPRYLRQADARINWEQRIPPRGPAPAGP